jgi:hypothetical protein
MDVVLSFHPYGMPNPEARCAAWVPKGPLKVAGRFIAGQITGLLPDRES